MRGGGGMSMCVIMRLSPTRPRLSEIFPAERHPTYNSQRQAESDKMKCTKSCDSLEPSARCRAGSDLAALFLGPHMATSGPCYEAAAAAAAAFAPTPSITPLRWARSWRAAG